jgi:hypothetical protein
MWKNIIPHVLSFCIRFNVFLIHYMCVCVNLDTIRKNISQTRVEKKYKTRKTCFFNG